jgi:hypothetical protein
MSYPKSYLTEAQRDELHRSSLSQNSIYIAESEAADVAGDNATAWAWLRLATVPAHTLLSLKKSLGADYVRRLGLDLTPAEAAYGKQWLDDPNA